MFLLFDIGGTHMRVAVSADGASITSFEIVPTPSSFKEGMLQFKSMVRALVNDDTVSVTSGGIAGTLNKGKSALSFSPNLRNWVKKPLKRMIEKITGGTVLLQNDAALAGLGEAQLGAGQGKRIVMYYTISTGVGGARIVDGRIDEGCFEPGHQIVCGACQKSSCTRPVYLEDYISGRGLAMRYQRDTSHISSGKIWDQVAKWLAYGLNNSIVHWSPEVVVLGGGLINHNAISVVKVRKYLKETLRAFTVVPLIKKGRLGDESGLYGALVYARQNLPGRSV
jgi:glucokinase